MHHRDEEHNPFFYFYFLMHLREKKENGQELSGVESFVESKVAADDASSEEPVHAGQRDVHVHPQALRTAPIFAPDAQVPQIQPEPEQTDIGQLKIDQ